MLKGSLPIWLSFVIFHTKLCDTVWLELLLFYSLCFCRTEKDNFNFIKDWDGLLPDTYKIAVFFFNFDSFSSLTYLKYSTISIKNRVLYLLLQLSCFTAYIILVQTKQHIHSSFSIFYQNKETFKSHSKQKCPTVMLRT